MGKIVEYFLKQVYEDERLVIHTKLLKSKSLEKLEQKLDTKNPMVVAKYFEKLPEKSTLRHLKKSLNI